MKDDLFSQLYENIKKIGLTKWIMLGIAGVLLIASSYLKKDEVNENKARYSQYEEKNTFNQKYEYKDEIEKEVEELVKNIKGVNKAKVMITLKSSEERIVKEDNEVVVENDEEALYEGLKELLSNDEKIQYYHEKAIERAVFFKKETRVREVEEMFEEL